MVKSLLKTPSKIQIYNPNTFELIRTFESIDEAIKNMPNPNKSKTRSMILLAISSNLIYENYRWIRLKPELPDDTIQELLATRFITEVETEPETKTEPIVEVETAAETKTEAKHKTRIKQVHPDTQKTIKIYNNIDEIIKEFRISRKSLRNAIANQTTCKGYNWCIISEE